ncbi:MAG TPA: division/cell wall cluster transcriptional repressor MraZ [Thermoanaerobaculia bacterium]|nr:division/cell wall cluster transcriptional repressor MraZ [Thermoanaerobaculia bacterium]
MFRGSAPAKIDDKGRLKIPTDFRRQLEERYGSEVFITSLHGDSAHVYPLPVWEGIESRLLSLPSTHPARAKYLERVNFFGQQLRLDGQGRVLIPQLLRDAAEMSGEVVVSGRIDHLVVWNRERLASRLTAEPITDDDFRALSELGI